MLTRWHILTLFILLLLSNLSAHAQCVFVNYPAFCSDTSCSCGNYLQYNTYCYADFFSPVFVIKCPNNKEFPIIEVVLSQFGLNAAMQYRITNSDSNNIVVYAEDQFFDYSQIGKSSVDKLLNSYTAYGSTSYQFTFTTGSVWSAIALKTSSLPNCSYNFGEKILKADDSNSATYQCGLFTEAINNPPYSGLGGCASHRCQYYSDKNLVAFCNSSYTDDECYLKADNVWMIGTEYDLSSLPKIMIYLTFLIIYFLGIAVGLNIGH